MINVLNNFADKWFSWEIAILWQVTVLIAFVWLIDLVIRKWAWPQLRYALWLLILIKLILPPTLTSPTSFTAEIGSLAQKAVTVQINHTETTPQVSDLAASSNEPIAYYQPAPAVSKVDHALPGPPLQPITPVTAAVPTAVSLSWKAYALFVWLSGTVILSAWLILRLANLRREHLGNDQQASLPDGFNDLLITAAKKLNLKKIPRVVLTDKVRCPAVFGVFRPVLLIPADKFIDLKPQDISHILLHELAHIKRGDLFIHAIHMCLQIAYWFNPLLWIIRKQLQNLREICCDATVAKILKEKTFGYRETLLETARQLLAEPVDPGLGLMGLFENSNWLVERLKWLKKNTWKNRRLRIITISVMVSIMITCVMPMAKAKSSNKISAIPQKTVKKEKDVLSIGHNTDNDLSGIVTGIDGLTRSAAYITHSGSKLWGDIKSDRHGRFTIKDVTDKPKVWIAYSHHSNAMGIFTIPEDYKGKTVQAVLNCREGNVEGRVVDGNGKGLAKKKIELVIRNGKGDTYILPVYRKSDKYGIYRSDMLFGDDIEIHARIAGDDKYSGKKIRLSYDQIYQQIPTLVIGDGNPRETDDGQAIYSGRIMDKKHQPIKGAKVHITYDMPDHMSMWVKDIMSDQDGRWSVRIPKSGSNLSFRLLHPEYLSFHFDGSSRKPSLEELKDGTNVMTMKPGVRITGTVTDDQGKPVKNAVVSAGRLYSSSGGKLIEDCTTDRTSADGSFSIGGLPLKKLELSVLAKGFAPATAKVRVKEKTKPVSIALEKGWTYNGRLIDKDGNPMEGIKVYTSEWKIGRNRKRIDRNDTSDSNGNFSIEGLPEKGTIEFTYGRNRSPYICFSKEVPAGASDVGDIVIHKKVFISGKVTDAQTGKPIPEFVTTNGIKWKDDDESIFWSRHYISRNKTKDGKFSRKWSGMLITYPFDGACFMKITAKGYLPEITPPVEIGKDYEPFEIQLTKADPWTGKILDSENKTVSKAQIGWVGDKEIAFIKNGKFDSTGWTKQVHVVVKSDSKGLFTMPPVRGKGIFVVLDKGKGYAIVRSEDFKNGSTVTLIPWAKIEGTNLTSKEQFKLRITAINTSENDKQQKIRWIFDDTSFSRKNFVIDHIPSIPLNIGKVIRGQQSNHIYLKPQPGETHNITLGGSGRTVIGKILFPWTRNLDPDSKETMTDPRQFHAVAFKVDPKEKPDDKFTNNSYNSSFFWLYQNTKNFYAPSKTNQKRFMPIIEQDGTFKFENMAPGKYDFVINLHAPLGDGISCGRGSLKAATVTSFIVDTKSSEPVKLPEIVLISSSWQ